MTLKRTPIKRSTKPIARQPIKRKVVMPNDRAISGQRVTGAVKAAPKKKKPKKPTATDWKRWCDELAGLICKRAGKCARCGSTEYLQWSHRVSRGYLATRWDEDNCDCACRGCHHWQHMNPLENEAWIQSRGIDLPAIKLKALTHERPDYPETFLRLFRRAEELEIDVEKFRKRLAPGLETR